MALSPGTTLGPYAVTAKIGEGGMGEVYRARDTTLDRDVALKVWPQAFTDESRKLRLKPWESGRGGRAHGERATHAVPHRPYLPVAVHGVSPVDHVLTRINFQGRRRAPGRRPSRGRLRWLLVTNRSWIIGGSMKAIIAGLVIVVTLCPSIAAGQIFGRGARTEFISGFGLRTFISVRERNRLLVDGTEVIDPAEREFRARVTPIGIVYGLRPTLSVITILPFVDKTLSRRDGAVQQRIGGAGGLGDALFLAKWRFYKRDRGRGTFQLATELGVKAPTGADDLRGLDDQLLPPALQRGSGSWDPTADFLVTYVPPAGRGRWIFTGDVGVTATTTTNDFEVGNQVSYDGMVKYRVHPARYPGRDTFLVFEVNGRWQDQARAGGRPLTDSGGHTVYLAPGIQFLLRQNVILEGWRAATRLAPSKRDAVGRRAAPCSRACAISLFHRGSSPACVRSSCARPACSARPSCSDRRRSSISIGCCVAASTAGWLHPGAVAPAPKVHLKSWWTPLSR